MTAENLPVRKKKKHISTILCKIVSFKLQLSDLYKFKETVSGKARWKIKLPLYKHVQRRYLKALEEIFAVKELCEIQFL